MPSATLITPKLELRPLAPAHILALVAGEAAFAQAFGLPAAAGLRGFFASAEMSAEYLDALRAAVGYDVWRHGFAAVHRADQQAVGLASFKGPPAKETVEIAYAIAPDYENQGLATEAARTLTQYTFDTGLVRTVRAHTLPKANASTRVLSKCGFSHVGLVVDPDDGPIWRWETCSRPSEVSAA